MLLSLRQHDLEAFTEAVIDHRIYVGRAPLQNLILSRAKSAFGDTVAQVIFKANVCLADCSILFLVFGSVARAIHGSFSHHELNQDEPQASE